MPTSGAVRGGGLTTEMRLQLETGSATAGVRKRWSWPLEPSGECGHFRICPAKPLIIVGANFQIHKFGEIDLWLPLCAPSKKNLLEDVLQQSHNSNKRRTRKRKKWDEKFKKLY